MKVAHSRTYMHTHKHQSTSTNVLPSCAWCSTITSLCTPDVSIGAAFPKSPKGPKEEDVLSAAPHLWWCILPKENRFFRFPSRKGWWQLHNAALCGGQWGVGKETKLQLTALELTRNSLTEISRHDSACRRVCVYVCLRASASVCFCSGGVAWVHVSTALFFFFAMQICLSILMGKQRTRQIYLHACRDSSTRNTIIKLD